MLDIKVIRENSTWVKNKLAARGVTAAEIDDLLKLDEQRRALLTQTEDLKAQRNRTSKAIATAKQDHQDVSDQVQAMKKVGQQIAADDQKLKKLKPSCNTF